METLKMANESAKGKRKTWTRTGKIGAVIVALLAISAVAVAAILFTQTLPKTPGGHSPVLTTTCSTLMQNGPTPPWTGASGTVLYTCGAASALTAIAGSATPTFSLPSGAVTLSYVVHSSSTTCTAGTSLVSGSPTAFSAGSYDYCLTYSSYPSVGIAGFTIQWSQP